MHIIQKSLNQLEFEWVKINGPFHKDIKVFVDTDTEIGKHVKNGFETFLYHDLMCLNRTNQVIYDIGAHLGYHTLGFLSLFSNNTSVYAFEPDLKNYIRLLMNIEFNYEFRQNIKIFDIAISDTNGEVPFKMYNDVEYGGSSMSHIDFTSDIKKHTVDLSSNVYVQSARLDDFVFNNGLDLPTIIKMDIEGAESRALLGAVEVIIKSKPIIFVEIHDILNMYKVLNFFNDIDYKYILLNTEKDGRCFIKGFYPKLVR